MMRFRLLMGQYVGDDPATNKSRTYVQGDVIETEIDLLKFNGQGMSPKFSREDYQPHQQNQPNQTSQPKQQNQPPQQQPQQQTPQPPNEGQSPPPAQSQPHSAFNKEDYKKHLDTLTLKELQSEAADEGVDVKGMAKREDIIKKLLAEVK